jgi:hypothetical protein
MANDMAPTTKNKRSDLENYKKISQHPLVDETGASRTECWIFKAK